MKTYDPSDLKDDRWLRKRDKILSYADHRCQSCGAENISLQVHHSYYRDGLKSWEYPDGSLIALCQDCHGRVIHGIEAKPELIIKTDGPYFDRKKTSAEKICEMFPYAPSFMPPNESIGERQLMLKIQEFASDKIGPVSLGICRRAIELLIDADKIYLTSARQYKAQTFNS